MSTILKALRRLEQEKAASGQRPLQEEVAAAPLLEQAPRRRWVPVLAILLGLGVGAAVWSQWPLGGFRSQESSEVAGEASPAAVPERVARAPVRRERTPVAPPTRRRDPTPAASEGELPDEAFASLVEVVKRPPVAPRIPIEIGRAAETTPPPAESPPVPATREPAPGRVVTRAPEPEVKRPPAVAKAPTPPSPVVAEALAPKPSPVVAEAPTPEPAPVAVRSPEPAPESESVRVEKTLWHPVASRRVAHVALGAAGSERVHEGDVVGRYVVSEIKPSGVVFLHDGKSVLRKIGEK